MGLEARKWRFPRGDANSIELTDLWIGEMGAMGWIDGKVVSVGEHDDLTLACWIADAAARMGGAKFGFLEDAPGQPAPVTAAPSPSKILKPGFLEDLVVHERRVLAAIQEGQQAECSPDAYFHGVRTALVTYVHDAIECGNMKRAAHGAAELQRLDAQLKVSDASDLAVLAKADPASYGATHVDGAPTPQDLGLIVE